MMKCGQDGMFLVAPSSTTACGALPGPQDRYVVRRIITFDKDGKRYHEEEIWEYDNVRLTYIFEW